MVTTLRATGGAWSVASRLRHAKCVDFVLSLRFCVCLSFSSQAGRKLTVAAAAAAAAVAMVGLSHSNGVLAAAPSVDFQAVEKVNAGAVHTRAKE